MGKKRINSDAKGKRAERQLKNKLNDLLGTECRRGQQYCGANGDADVVGIPGVHIECKADQRLNVHNAVGQAVDDAREGETPVVIHKKNGLPWLVTCRLEDWPDVSRKISEIGK